MGTQHWYVTVCVVILLKFFALRLLVRHRCYLGQGFGTTTQCHQLLAGSLEVYSWKKLLEWLGFDNVLFCDPNAGSLQMSIKPGNAFERSKEASQVPRGPPNLAMCEGSPGRDDNTMQDHRQCIQATVQAACGEMCCDCQGRETPKA